MILLYYVIFSPHQIYVLPMWPWLEEEGYLNRGSRCGLGCECESDVWV